MTHALDEFDRQIIRLLQQDGRLSNVEIARSLGLSEGTVRKRLERLLSTGIVRVQAVMNPVALGLSASVFMGIQTELGQLNAVAQRLAALPEVRRVDIVTGTFDIMIEALLPSGELLLTFLVDRVATIPGVKRTETSHVIQVVKRACDWPLPEPTGAPAAQLHAADTANDQIVPGALVVPSKPGQS